MVRVRAGCAGKTAAVWAARISVHTASGYSHPWQGKGTMGLRGAFSRGREVYDGSYGQAHRAPAFGRRHFLPHSCKEGAGEFGDAMIVCRQRSRADRETCCVAHNDTAIARMKVVQGEKEESAAERLPNSSSARSQGRMDRHGDGGNGLPRIGAVSIFVPWIG